MIVEEFARLSTALRLMYIYPQIEKNRNVQLSQFFTGSYATGGALRDSGFEFDNEKWTQLEPYFPFDPFQLSKSKRWLDLPNTYVSWKPFALLNKDEDETEDTEGELDDDTEDEAASVQDDGASVQEDTATDDEHNDD